MKNFVIAKQARTEGKKRDPHTSGVQGNIERRLFRSIELQRRRTSVRIHIKASMEISAVEASGN